MTPPAFDAVAIAGISDGWHFAFPSGFDTRRAVPAKTTYALAVPDSELKISMVSENMRHNRYHVNQMKPEIKPEFVRLPKPKQNCAHSGLSRTGLYNLTVPCKANGFRPAVPAKCLRQPGNLRGIWLIPFAKLIAFLHELPEG